MFNSVIKSNDQNVVTKLQDNIDMLESRITYMQSVNDYYTKMMQIAPKVKLPDLKK